MSSPEAPPAPPMSGTSSEPITGETRDATFRFSSYPCDPCDPCDPWFIYGWLLDHGFHGFHGWARRRGCEPERANQTVEAKATRSLASMARAGYLPDVRGRRASPFRSYGMAGLKPPAWWFSAAKTGKAFSRKERRERKERNDMKDIRALCQPLRQKGYGVHVKSGIWKFARTDDSTIRCGGVVWSLLFALFAANLIGRSSCAVILPCGFGSLLWRSRSGPPLASMAAATS